MDSTDKILIIGSSGYYGKHLCEHNFFEDAYKISRKSAKKNYKNYFSLDIIKDDLSKLLKIKPKFVINLTTPKVEAKLEDHIKINQDGLKNIINFCNKNDSILIHFSSVVVYDSNKTDYQTGKILSEKLIKHELQNGLILRSHLIFTPNLKYYRILKFFLFFKFLKFIIPKRFINYKLNNPIHFSDVNESLKSIILSKKIDYKKVPIFDLKGPTDQTVNEIFKGEKLKRKYSKLEKLLNLEFKYIF
tara:strand:- start:2816 stop:3553 length:738 start_codon:yes stop_codon:yes gene_type:complete